MKHVDEYRDAKGARTLAAGIRRVTTRPWTVMEICGGQTHAIVRFGIDELLPREITMVHGPGCPVCVTPLEMIDRAIAVARRDDVIFCTFGDMLRVPGTGSDLARVKASGGDVRIVYSPLDALRIAGESRSKEVVFFAVGFETTAPANAMAVYQARESGLSNFSALVSQVLVPPAMDAILSSPRNRVQGFLAAGHVCTVTGYDEYRPIAEKHRVPVVVTGFEPLDILSGVYHCVRRLEEGRAGVENAYGRAVKREGNRAAKELVNKVFRVVDRKWRGIGEIARSGLALADDYAEFDAARRFVVGEIVSEESPECISGLVLQGDRKPHQCGAFGRACTPEHPLGATMVSAEGACAAYYRYRRREEEAGGE